MGNAADPCGAGHVASGQGLGTGLGDDCRHSEGAYGWYHSRSGRYGRDGRAFTRVAGARHGNYRCGTCFGDGDRRAPGSGAFNDGAAEGRHRDVRRREAERAALLGRNPDDGGRGEGDAVHRGGGACERRRVREPRHRPGHRTRHGPDERHWGRAACESRSAGPFDLRSWTPGCCTRPNAAASGHRGSHIGSHPRDGSQRWRDSRGTRRCRRRAGCCFGRAVFGAWIAVQPRRRLQGIDSRNAVRSRHCSRERSFRPHERC